MNLHSLTGTTDASFEGLMNTRFSWEWETRARQAWLQLSGGSPVGLTHLILGTLMRMLGLYWGLAVFMGELEGWLSEVGRVGFGCGGPAVGKVHFRT